MPDFLTERQAVVDACRDLSARGFLAGTGGNVALRLDERHFAVTPSATDYAAMAAQDIAVLRLDTREQIAGTRPASVERGLHAALLAARPDRRASVHTHQPVASAVAVLHERLAWRPGTDLALYGTQVGLVPYRPSGTGLLVKALVRSLRPDLHAFLLASHGVICAAPSLADAAAMVAEVEASAAAHLRAAIAARPGLDAGLRELALTCLDAIRAEEARS